MKVGEIAWAIGVIGRAIERAFTRVPPRAWQVGAGVFIVGALLFNPWGAA